jgi:hypothetical protein
MSLDGIGWVFLGGMGGALLLELVKLVGWRDQDVISARYKSWKYWVGTLALFLVSGAVAVWKCGSHATLEHAVQLGIDAPAIVGGFATASTTRRKMKRPERFAPVPQGMPPEQPSLFELLSW